MSMKGLLSIQGVFVVMAFALFGYFLGQYLIQSNLLYSKLDVFHYKTIYLPADSHEQPSNDSIYSLAHAEVHGDSCSVAACTAKLSGVQGSQNYPFNQIPEFLVWNILVGIMLSIAFASLPIAVAMVRLFHQGFNLRRRYYLASALAAMMIGVIVFIITKSTKGFLLPQVIISKLHILLTNADVVEGIVGITIVCSLSMVAVMFVALYCARDLLQSHLQLKRELLITKIDHIKSVFSGSILFLAMMIVMTVLTSGALGATIRKAITIKEFSAFPQEATYVYGLHFSLFIGIIYLPCSYYINMCFKQIRADIQLHVPSDQNEKDDELDKLLAIDIKVWDKLKTALVLISPLLSALVPDLFKIFFN